MARLDWRELGWRLGLAREEYSRFFLAGQQGDYPVDTPWALSELRDRGYDLTHEQLKYLVRKGTVELPDRTGRYLKWSAEAIDRVAEWAEDERAFTPQVHMCWCLGVSYSRWLEGLHLAAAEASSRHRQVVPPTIENFVLHAEAPNPGQRGRVWFTLRDDVRTQLEPTEDTENA